MDGAPAARPPRGRRPTRLVRLCVAAALALTAAVATEAASRLIAARFPHRPSAPDIVFEALPRIPFASYVTLAAMALSVALLLAHLLRTAPARVPEAMALMSVMYLLRAAMLVLTPLAPARDGSVLAFPLFANGLFPSGHTALAVLAVWLTDRRVAPRLHLAQTALASVVVVSMLFSRGHYSIDIVGGALLAYFVGHEWESGRLLRPLRTLVAPARPPAETA